MPVDPESRRAKDVVDLGNKLFSLLIFLSTATKYRTKAS